MECPLTWAEVASEGGMQAQFLQIHSDLNSNSACEQAFQGGAQMDETA